MKKEYFDYDASQDKPWQENAPSIPVFPQDRYLLPVSLSQAYSFKVFVDEKSVTLLEDRVLRFSLVVESKSGARSIFYDGFRCETDEYKTYAVGSAVSTLQAVKKPSWQRIPNIGSQGFRQELVKLYVCKPESQARAPTEFIQSIKYPQPKND